MDSFSLFSPTHLLALLVCLAVPVWVVKTGKNGPGNMRRIIAVASLFTWLLTVLYPVFSDRFTWKESLPLHFCNLANLLGAIAVLSQKRLPRSILYFWGVVLCSWAFLTPSLSHGPAHLWFWIFWLYHLCIPVALLWILVRENYRPGFSDLRNALIVTWAFTLLLAVLDHFTGWNYGFVGPGMPLQKSPMDVLGPYPLRILWMLIIGTFLFFLAWLPWPLSRKFSKSS